MTAEVEKQVAALSRIPALQKSLVNDSAILISDDWNELLEWANAFAAEHVNIQTKDDNAILGKLRHGGAIFVGPYSPVAAGAGVSLIVLRRIRLEAGYRFSRIHGDFAFNTNRVHAGLGFAF